MQTHDCNTIEYMINLNSKPTSVQGENLIINFSVGNLILVFKSAKKSIDLEV